MSKPNSEISTATLQDFCHVEGNHHPLREDLKSVIGPSPLVADVIAGPEPSLNTFLLGHRDGRCEIFHSQDVHLFVQKIMACTEVYYFGTEVYGQILQSCLVVNRADLAGRIVEGIFLRSWIDLQQRLAGSLCNKSGESLEAGESPVTGFSGLQNRKNSWIWHVNTCNTYSWRIKTSRYWILLMCVFLNSVDIL